MAVAPSEARRCVPATVEHCRVCTVTADRVGRHADATRRCVVSRVQASPPKSIVVIRLEPGVGIATTELFRVASDVDGSRFCIFAVVRDVGLGAWHTDLSGVGHVFEAVSCSIDETVAVMCERTEVISGCCSADVAHSVVEARGRFDDSHVAFVRRT